MILVVAATTGELSSLQKLSLHGVHFLVAGVGLLETSYNLTQYLLGHPEITQVINIGIAGGFPPQKVTVLDSCLATSETVADLGITFDSHLLPLDSSFLVMDNLYTCDNPLLSHFSNWLQKSKQSYTSGPFISVNGVSGTISQANKVNRNQAICENMEGAAVARVCHGLSLDWFEFRVVSNLVEDRDVSKWQIAPAINKCSQIISSYLEGSHL